MELVIPFFQQTESTLQQDSQMQPKTSTCADIGRGGIAPANVENESLVAEKGRCTEEATHLCDALDGAATTNAQPAQGATPEEEERAHFAAPAMSEQHAPRPVTQHDCQESVAMADDAMAVIREQSGQEGSAVVQANGATSFEESEEAREALISINAKGKAYTGDIVSLQNASDGMTASMNATTSAEAATAVQHGQMPASHCTHQANFSKEELDKTLLDLEKTRMEREDFKPLQASLEEANEESEMVPEGEKGHAEQESQPIEKSCSGVDFEEAQGEVSANDVQDRGLQGAVRGEVDAMDAEEPAATDALKEASTNQNEEGKASTAGAEARSVDVEDVLDKDSTDDIQHRDLQEAVRREVEATVDIEEHAATDALNEFAIERMDEGKGLMAERAVEDAMRACNLDGNASRDEAEHIQGIEVEDLGIDGMHHSYSEPTMQDVKLDEGSPADAEKIEAALQTEILQEPLQVLVRETSGSQQTSPSAADGKSMKMAPPWASSNEEFAPYPKRRKLEHSPVVGVKIEEEGDFDGTTANVDYDEFQSKPDENMSLHQAACNAELTTALLTLFKVPMLGCMNKLPRQSNEAADTLYEVLTGVAAKTKGVEIYKFYYNIIFKGDAGKENAEVFGFVHPDKIPTFAVVDLTPYNESCGGVKEVLRDIYEWYSYVRDDIVLRELDKHEALNYYIAALDVIMVKKSITSDDFASFIATYKHLASMIPERFRMMALTHRKHRHGDVTHGVGRSFELVRGTYEVPATAESVEHCRRQVREFVTTSLKLDLTTSQAYNVLDVWLASAEDVILDDDVVLDALRRCSQRDRSQFLSMLACRKGACHEYLRMLSSAGYPELWPAACSYSRA